MFPPKLDAKELETRSVEEEELEKAQEENVDEVAFLINEDIIQCFALFDQNKTGTFPSKYLDKALKCLGILITSVELEDVEQNVAKDGKTLAFPFSLHKELRIDLIHSHPIQFIFFQA